MKRKVKLSDYWAKLKPESSNRRLGVLVFLFLIGVYLVSKRLVTEYIITNADVEIADTLLLKKIAAYYGDTLVVEKGLPVSEDLGRPVFQRFNFDPNTLDSAGWISLGLPKGPLKGLLKYRKKGGVFRVKSDVAKVYFFPESLYVALRPFIQLPDSLPKKEYPKREVYVPKHLRAITFSNINTVDTNFLTNLVGIGIGSAKRILKYRTELGGFLDTAQYKEIWGLDSTALQSLKQHTFAGSKDSIKAIQINFASETALAKHPYVGRYAANRIIKYRLQHKTIDNIQQLEMGKVIKLQDLKRLEPYLDFSK